MALGTGISITFATSGWTGRLAGALSQGGEERAVVDDADHSITSGARPQLIGQVYMPPAVTMEIIFDPADPPPIGAAPEQITITYPDGTTHAGQGAIVARDWQAPYEDSMRGSFRIQFTEAPVVTPAP